MAGQQGPSTTVRSRNTIRGIVLAVLVVASVGALSYWTVVCPCDRIPGGYLVGAEARERVTDWSFANKVLLCQIQTSAWLLPHSINLNCMAAPTGELYLSCSGCADKRWSNAALEDGRARLRLDGTVYSVTLTRVTDPDELDRAWSARVAKLEYASGPGNPAPPPGATRPDSWWSFRVTSR
jgi:hypothetical protein